MYSLSITPGGSLYDFAVSLPSFLLLPPDPGNPDQISALTVLPLECYVNGIVQHVASMLLHLSVSLSCIPLHGCITVYLFASCWAFGLFQVFGYYE